MENRWKNGFNSKSKHSTVGKNVCEMQCSGLQIKYPDSWPRSSTNSNTSTAGWKKKGFSLGPYFSRNTFLHSKERDEGKIRCLFALKGNRGISKYWIKCKIRLHKVTAKLSHQSSVSKIDSWPKLGWTISADLGSQPIISIRWNQGLANASNTTVLTHVIALKNT